METKIQIPRATIGVDRHLTRRQSMARNHTMKKQLVALGACLSLSFAGTTASFAGSVDAQPLTQVEVVEMSADDAATSATVEDVDGGSFGTFFGLTLLAVAVVVLAVAVASD